MIRAKIYMTGVVWSPHMLEKKHVFVVAVFGAVLLTMAFSAAASSHGGEKAYAGTHVEFDTSENAVTEFTVDGETVFDSLEVESRTEAEARGAAGVGVDVGAGVGGEGGVDLSALSDVQGAAVANVNVEARASANVGFDSGAEFEAHDNANGVAVLKSGDEEQLVEVEIAADAEAETADQSVVTFTSDGTESSLIVAGEGEAGINDEGDVAAHLETGTNAVVRAYGEEKSEDDEQQERLIADGNVAAEVQFGEDREGEVAGDPADFLSGTDVDVDIDAGESVSLTVDRTESEGKVVMTTVTDAAVGTTEELNVEIDGEAAVEADSYSELEAGIGEETRYLVTETEAEGQAQVLVAVDSFSERQVVVEGEEEETVDETDDDVDEETDDETDDEEVDETADETEDDDTADEEEGLPGFTVVAALVAALTAVAARSRVSQ